MSRPPDKTATRPDNVTGLGGFTLGLALAVASSAVVAAIVGALAGYVAQRRLADRQARIDYELNARKRLYEAIGPLRFQLTVAARDVVRRVGAHHLTSRWNLRVDDYYGRSFVYRILRPLAVSELIEREMSYADFSVDPAGIELLRFQVAAYRMLTGGDPLPYYDGLDWTAETQHVFRDNLRAAASRLIGQDRQGRDIVINYARFVESIDPTTDPSIRPLANLLESCGESLTNNAVFWVRLVGYAYVCWWLLERHGNGLGFANRSLEVRAMLEATNDVQLRKHLDEYPELFELAIREGL